MHYVECMMCALMLINNYETLHIETYCDWSGPSYPITIDSTNYGNGNHRHTIHSHLSPRWKLHNRQSSLRPSRGRQPHQPTAIPSTLHQNNATYCHQTRSHDHHQCNSKMYGHPNKLPVNPTYAYHRLVAVAGVAVVVGALLAYI